MATPVPALLSTFQTDPLYEYDRHDDDEEPHRADYQSLLQEVLLVYATAARNAENLNVVSMAAAVLTRISGKFRLKDEDFVENVLVARHAVRLRNFFYLRLSLSLVSSFFHSS